MRKKIFKGMMAVTLALPLAIPTYQIVPVSATTDKTELVSFLKDSEHSFNGSSSTILKKTEHLEEVKNAKSFTYMAQYRTTTPSEEIHSLFFVGNESKIDNYVNFYVKPIHGSGSRIGIELRNGSDNKHVYIDLPEKKLNDGKFHSLGFTINEGNGYTLYLDGKPIKQLNENPTRTIKNCIEDPEYYSFGGGYRGTGNGYPARGIIKNVRLYTEALNSNEILDAHREDSVGLKPIAELKNVASTQTTGKEATIPNASSTESYSLHTVYRHTNGERFNVAGIGNDAIQAFVDPVNKKIGLHYDNKNVEVSVPETAVSQDKWHALTYVVDKANNRLQVYVDKQLVGTIEGVKALNEFTADKLAIGSNLNGNIERLQLFGKVASQADINELHELTDYQFRKIVNPEGTYDSGAIPLFKNGYAGSNNYRIPALLTTQKGTVIAAIDKRNQHWYDWGNIDTFVRRSTDGGKTWDEGRTVVDMIDDENAGTKNSAFVIDPVLVQDKTNQRVHMLVDSFAEGQGFFTIGNNSGTDTVEVEGKKYPRLRNSNNEVFYYKEDGKVYNSNHELTTYKVTVQAEQPFRELGDLYEGENRVGNIYQLSSPLRRSQTANIIATHSDDEGQTWSTPVNITPQVKEEWMKFFGTGPGVGIQLANNRLVVPIYYTNQYGKQSSALIYSDDNGQTWRRGESPNDNRVENGMTYHSRTLNDSSKELTESQVIQLNDGTLKLFMRNQTGRVVIATSHDNGETWDNTLEQTDINDPYCQMSVIHYGNVDGKELIVFSNPDASRGSAYSGRRNGTLRIGEVNNGRINWTASQVLETGRYAYSSITKLPNGNIGLLYEAQKGDDINISYREVDLNWIKAGLVNAPAEAPRLETISATEENGKLKITANFNQKVLVAGDLKLQLSLADKQVEATYVDGSGTSTLTFELPLNGDERGILTATGITGGVAEGTYKHPIEFNNNYIRDFDIVPQNEYTMTSNNFQPSDRPSNAADGNPNTIWHSKWDKSEPTPHTLTMELREPTDINRFVYVPRQEGDNGFIKRYRIETSLDGTNFEEVATGTFAANAQTKEVEFPSKKAKFVRLVSLEGHNGFSSAAEVYVKRSPINANTPETPINKQPLQEKFNELSELFESGTVWSGFEELQTALANATEILNKANATQEEVDQALAALVAADKKVDTVVPISAENTATLVGGSTDLSPTDKLTVTPVENVAALAGKEYAANKLTLTDAQGTPKTLTKRGLVLLSTLKRPEKIVKINDDGTLTEQRIINIDEDAGVFTAQFMVDQVGTYAAIFGDAPTPPLVVNKAELEAAVKSVDNLVESEYTSDTWNALKQAIDNAKAVLSNANATQEEVNAQVQAIAAAKTALKRAEIKVNKQGLEAVLARSEAIQKDKYTSESVEKLEKAHQEARTVFEKQDATQEEVDAARVKLSMAIDQLQAKAPIDDEKPQPKPQPEKPQPEQPKQDEKPTPDIKETPKEKGDNIDKTKPSKDNVNKLEKSKDVDTADYSNPIAMLVATAGSLIALIALKRRKK